MGKRSATGRKCLLAFHVTEEEADYIRTTAKRLNLSVSDFARNIIFNMKLPDPERLEGIQELRRLRADLARVGNLFFLAMDETNLPQARLEAHVAEIRAVADLIKDKVLSL